MISRRGRRLDAGTRDRILSFISDISFDISRSRDTEKFYLLAGLKICERHHLRASSI